MKSEIQKLKKYNLLDLLKEYYKAYILMIIGWCFAIVMISNNRYIFGISTRHKYGDPKYDFPLVIFVFFYAIWVIVTHHKPTNKVVNYIVKHEPALSEKYGINGRAWFLSFSDEDIEKMLRSEVSREFKKVFNFPKKLFYGFILMAILGTIFMNLAPVFLSY